MRLFVATAALALLCVHPVDAQSLRGSLAAMQRQHGAALAEGVTFTRTASDVYRLADSGQLVHVEGNEDYEIGNVSYPFIRAEGLAVLEHIAMQYRAGCDEKLVVTSLTRPTGRQPRNASQRSVHPAGLALDLRRSFDARCRRHLEGLLLELEASGLIDATLERRPPHYHVAILPRSVRSSERIAMRVAPRAPAAVKRDEARRYYTVGRGDSLSRIAQTFATDVETLQRLNALTHARLRPGQVLLVAVGRTGSTN